MSRRRNRRLLMPLILGTRMCRRHRPQSTARLALQSRAHRLPGSAHVSAGLHLASQEFLVAIFFKREQLHRARLEALVEATEHPRDSISDTVGLHDPQKLTVA